MDNMEPPTPFENKTPKGQLENIKQEISFSMRSNKNNNFIIFIKNLQSYILLSAQIKNEFNYVTYEKKYYFDELIKNKYLCICDSIDEIYEQLNLELKKNTFKINEEENKIKIIIPIEGFIKVKDIYFELPKKIKNEKEIIQDLLNEITIIKKEILNNKNISMEISEIKKDNEELKEKLINEIKEQKELKIQIENIELINKNIEDRIKSIYDIIIKNKYNIINESK